MTDPKILDEFAIARSDLSWLAQHGALAGVAEILRERRHQIEDHGWTPAHDREQHEDSWLVHRAQQEAMSAHVGLADGFYGPADVERHMARSAATAAAEIDRLQELVRGGD